MDKERKERGVPPEVGYAIKTAGLWLEEFTRGKLFVKIETQSQSEEFSDLRPLFPFLGKRGPFRNRNTGFVCTHRWRRVDIPRIEGKRVLKDPETYVFIDLEFNKKDLPKAPVYERVLERFRTIENAILQREDLIADYRETEGPEMGQVLDTLGLLEIIRLFYSTPKDRNREFLEDLRKRALQILASSGLENIRDEEKREMRNLTDRATKTDSLGRVNTLLGRIYSSIGKYKAAKRQIEIIKIVQKASRELPIFYRKRKEERKGIRDNLSKLDELDFNEPTGKLIEDLEAIARRGLGGSGVSPYFQVRRAAAVLLVGVEPGYKGENRRLLGVIGPDELRVPIDLVDILEAPLSENFLPFGLNRERQLSLEYGSAVSCLVNFGDRFQVIRRVELAKKILKDFLDAYSFEDDEF